MRYWITAEPGYLRARLFGRETVEETQEFLRTVVLENRSYRRSAILLDIRFSRPIFHLEPHGFFEHFRRLSGNSSCRVALLGDTADLRLSNEYLALLARQQGLNVLSFRTDAMALKWLTERRQHEERREPSERRQAMDGRPVSGKRRRRARRLSLASPQSAR